MLDRVDRMLEGWRNMWVLYHREKNAYAVLKFFGKNCWNLKLELKQQQNEKNEES